MMPRRSPNGPDIEADVVESPVIRYCKQVAITAIFIVFFVTAIAVLEMCVAYFFDKDREAYRTYCLPIQYAGFSFVILFAVLRSTYLMIVVIASLVYMVRERTWEFFLFDELASFIICVLIWREAYKWSHLVEKMIWKPQPCTVESNLLDASTPNTQLLPEETDGEFEVIKEDCHTDCCSNVSHDTLDALIKGFVFNTEKDTTAGGTPSIDADHCTSEVKSRVFAFYMKVANYLSKVYSIVSPGNRTPEACTENVLQLLLLAIIEHDNSTVHLKLGDPFLPDPTKGITILDTAEYALNENERTEALAFANRVFGFISHKLAIDRKVIKETINPAQDHECKRMYKFVAHMLATFDSTSLKKVNLEMDTGLLIRKIVKHSIEMFAVVKPGDTTPETKYKIIKRLLLKTKFNGNESSKSKNVEGYSNTEFRGNTTGAENTLVSVPKKMFDSLFIKVGLKSPKVREATAEETVKTNHVVGNSTCDGNDTVGAEITTLSAHEEDEVSSLLERIFSYLGILDDLKKLIDLETTAETGNSTPAERTYIHKFIADMLRF